MPICLLLQLGDVSRLLATGWQPPTPITECLGLLTPQADGTSNYSSQATAPFAKNLKGKLLLAHGLLDNNVPPHNTLLVVDALIKANKTFDLVLLPPTALMRPIRCAAAGTTSCSTWPGPSPRPTTPGSPRPTRATRGGAVRHYSAARAACGGRRLALRRIAGFGHFTHRPTPDEPH